MPLGGERVGTAYVQLIADGSSVPDDIREAMDRLEPTLRQAGEDHAAAYDKGFDKQYEADNEKFRDKLDKRLAKALGRMTATGRILGEKVGDNLFDGIQASLTEAFDDDVAERIRQNLQKAFAEDQSLDRLKVRISDVNRLAMQASKELVAEAERASAIKIKAENDLQREIGDTISETDRLVESIKRENRARDTGLDNAIAGLAKLRHEQAKAETVFERFNRQLRGIFKKGEEGWRSQADEVDRVTSRYIRFNHTLDDTAKRVGQVTGKGSRNDFLNFFGSVTAGITSLGTLLLKVPGFFQQAFRGEGSIDIGKMLSSAASSIIAVALALTAVTLVLSPLAALVSGLTAAVIALAGSLVFAAAAAGGVALVLGGVLVAAIGAAVGAYASLSDAQKDVLQDSFQPLIDGAKEFGDAVAKNMLPGLERAGELMAPLADGAEKVGKSVGSAFGDVARYFARAVTSPGFLLFRDAFEDFLPKAIRDLGAIATDTLGGIGGIFRAAIPFAQQFLNWVRRNTKEFSDWANSAEGQNQLANFFEQAADSARSVGGFITEALELIGDLLSAGSASGDTLFDDMADSFQRLTDYLKENPEAVKEWFANGVEVAREIGDLIVAVGKAIDDLDTEEARTALSALFEIAQDAVEGIGQLAPVFEKIIDALLLVRGAYLAVYGFIARTWGRVIALFGRAPGALEAIADAAGRVVNRVGGFFASLPGKVIGFIRRIPGRAGALLDKVAYQAGLAVGRTIRFFVTLPGKVIAAIRSLPGQAAAVFTSLVARAIAIGTRIVGWFQRLPSRIGNALSSLASTVKGKFDDAVDKVRGIPDQIAGFFSGLAGKILSAIGTIDIGSLIKMPGGAIGKFADGVISGLKGDAAGRILTGPEIIYAGEAGPEAIVPLNRPLSQVDPSVRGLSAIAQGYAAPGGTGTTVDVGGVTIVTPTRDPAAVATETINKIVAAAM